MEKSRKKILYLITKSNFGGAQKYVHELALEAKQRGYNVSVACGGTGERNGQPGKLVEKLQEASIPIHPIKHFMRDMSVLDDVRAMFEVVGLLFKEKPDVLHVTSSKAGGIGAFAGRLAGTKHIVFTSHGLTMDESWRPTWQRILITWFTWFTIFLCDRSIMISTETYERAKKLPFLSKKVEMIFNGINDITFKDKMEARNELLPNLPTETFLIGGVGELHSNKNWQSLIQAMASLPNNVHTAIIGEGEEKVNLERQISELQLQNRVHLLGYIDAAEYLKMFDVFILPSKKEGLPYVLLEAGLAQIPIVASNLPGNHDIIVHEQSGLLITPEPQNLAENISKLLDLPDLRQHYAESINKSVKQKFSLPQMMDKTFKQYLI